MIRVSVSVAVAALVLLSTGVLAWSEGALGEVVSHAELDKLVALGCGQFPGTNGTEDCSVDSIGCEQTLAGVGGGGIYGYTCDDEYTQCGSCTGSANVECQEDIDPTDTTLCFEYNVLCCTPEKACITTSSQAQQGTFYSCSCTHVGPGGDKMGERTLGDLSYEDPHCGGGGS